MNGITMLSKPGSGGILSIPAPSTEDDSPLPVPVSRPSVGKTPVPRTKIIIRRLPPGLTQEEFEDCLGDEWKVGNGKVDWYIYKYGKISTDLAKPSKPARAYVHLTDQSLLTDLVDTIRDISFIDAKNTFTDASLLGPPSVEFAPFNKIPSNKVRKDARMGTIDQDPDFIDFLEGLTNPVLKALNEEADAEKNSDDVATTTTPTATTTTPLIEFLKEKKANKTKEQPPVKQSKHTRKESKDSKTDGKIDATSIKKLLKPEKHSALNEKTSHKELKSEKVPKETIKLLTKHPAKSQSSQSQSSEPTPSKTAESQPSKPSAAPSKAAEPSSPVPTAIEHRPERKRGNPAAAAARILQRDLGITVPNAPKSPRGKSARPAARADQTETKSPISATARDATSEPGRKASRPPQSPKSRPRTIAKREHKAEAQSQSPKPPSASTTPNAHAPTIKIPKIQQRPHPASNQTPSTPTTRGQKQLPTQPKSHNQSTNQNTKPSSPAPSTNKSTSKTSAATSNSTLSAAPLLTTATQAFLKHANPSQGITEPLLTTAFVSFGRITNVEIDKKKGFAYIDFAEPEGLQNAIKASPVKVAQGQVVVLERKTGQALKDRNAARNQRGPTSTRGGGRQKGKGRGGKDGKDASEKTVNSSTLASTSTPVMVATGGDKT